MTKAQTTNNKRIRVAAMRMDWGSGGWCARVGERGTATPQTWVVKPVFKLKHK